LKIGVISYLLRHLSTPDAMQFLRGIGFDAVELDFRHADGRCDYHTVDAAGAADVRKLLESYGITPWAYCVGGLGKWEAANLERVFQFASGLGVEVVVGLLQPAILPEISALCDKYKICYAIENHAGDVFESAETILGALQGQSPLVGVNVDTGHFAAAGLDPVAEMRKLEGRIMHVHFKDSDQRRPFGTGSVDLAGVYAELKRQGYRRLLSIEHYEYEGIDDETLREGLVHALSYTNKLVSAAA